MKFKIENLGLLDSAELEISDLTVICGENNTGKTYATYAVYGFLRSWRQLLQNILVDEIGRKIGASGNCRIDLEETFSGKVDDYLARATHAYIDTLPQVFATREEVFESSNILVEVDAELDLSSIEYKQRVQSGPAGKVLATITKEAGSNELEVLVSDNNVRHFHYGGLSAFVADAIIEIVFKEHLPRVHISSAERTGAAIFRKELDMARTRMLKALSEMDSKELKNPFALLQKMDADYAWPVEDNVEFVRGLEDIDKQVSDLAKNSPEIMSAFDAVIGGSYKVIKDQGLVFQAKGAGKQRFTMSESSSCVRALLDIGFYLRCKARPGDLFIIDEPELNLHPKNQRALARLLARLVNAGVKVFITTHSDYLVKEFNTLIMLHQGTEHARNIQSEYEYEDAELIDPERVRLYMTGTELRAAKQPGKRATRINVLKKANIYPDRGIEVSTFDETIEIMNDIQSKILYGGEL